MLTAGSQLTPNLRLERELGRGAMGVVWVARNIHLDTEVAVKVLLGAQEETSRARFVQEARGLAQIDSPHVVRIFDFGLTEDGEPFIVMELLQGQDLRERIQQRGALTLSETVSIVRQVCHALGAAHAAGIVHRDIKPANVFIARGEGELSVKVLDFGVAKFIGAQLGMTATGALVGTPYYSSPEQLLTPNKIDHRSDIWSVGVLVYACLTGTLPFLGETLAALSLAIHAAHFEPPCGKNPALPPAIDSWMRRSLSRKPEDRFATAKEQADALAMAERMPRVAATEMPLRTVLMETSAPETAPAPVLPRPAPAAVEVHAALAQSTLAPMSAMTAPGVPPPRQAAGRTIVAAAIIALVAASAAVALTIVLTRQDPQPGTPAAARDEPTADDVASVDAPGTSSASARSGEVAPAASPSALPKLTPSNQAPSNQAPSNQAPPPPGPISRRGQAPPPAPPPVPFPVPPAPNGDNPFKTRH